MKYFIIKNNLMFIFYNHIDLTCLRKFCRLRELNASNIYPNNLSISN